jgi:DegV family protein with EDD domain
MPRVCILTDSTAQFTRNGFPGHAQVFVIPFEFQPAALPDNGFSAQRSPGKRLSPPSPQQFLQRFHELSNEYDSILVITLSSYLSPVNRNALSASIQFNGTATVDVVDSRLAASGLGWVVEMAAGALYEGETPGEIVKRVRAAIPRVHVLLFIPDLELLAEAGQFSSSQVLLTGRPPVFTLEDGRLMPAMKSHSQGEELKCFEEFLQGFECPRQIAMLHGSGDTTMRTRSLSQRIRQIFPNTYFSEHNVTPHLAAMLGNQCIGLAVMDKG